MAIVTRWQDLLEETIRKFPETAQSISALHEGDIGGLMRHVAEAHDLTFAEAAEVVTFRLPHYLEETALSA